MTWTEPAPQLERVQLPAGEARVAVMRRTYDAPVEDVWDACTSAERLARWYTTVEGDFRVGGTFTQVNMGGGTIEACEAPTYLRVLLGGGVDQIELRLTDLRGSTGLELRHATTFDTHEIGGQLYDAIFCMGGGYYPRFYALSLHLAGSLPEAYDPTQMHLDPRMRPYIDRGSDAMQQLLEAAR
jgi:hypothetical protein